ncbi:MAG: malate synthase [Thermonema sp.]|uniref:malate synthase A n=1 Tax=Thermonema sp. TaxID=2231181 RepID=UPI0021DC075E|nr:malate synthase A [Thermonema sp.]GIV39631.1 MAG: malate synthase [Thermonema sp.]
MSTPVTTEGIRITAPLHERYEEILSPEALRFVAHLHRTFNAKRKALLAEREARFQAISEGQPLTFPKETEEIRGGDWQVAPIPQDLQDRRVEITGPVDRKMIINALNSGAKVFMADFEDANSPTWTNCVEGQINLYDAIRRQIDFTAPNGKQYSLKEKVAVLKVRPRGWHLPEKHVLIDGEPVSASLFDFGLYFFHNAKELLARGSGPYFYLPKLESYQEAALWNEVFVEAQQYLDIPVGTIKATVLIETITAAFEMEEIIYALRDHMAGLNAGRWDYIFSAIKKFRNRPEVLFPDRAQVTMTVPFMRAYAMRVVQACHLHGAHAIGGMSAFIPSRKDEEVNRRAFDKVYQDKALEAHTGYDGTWVAHPDLVPVALQAFKEVLGDSVHQKDEKRSAAYVITPNDLTNFHVEGGKITEQGVRTNINVGILYIESWLQGVGAAALYNLMEDAATAEISRAQLWQWLHNPRAIWDDGRRLTPELYGRLKAEEVEKIKQLLGADRVATGKLQQAIELFDRLVLEKDFIDFLTLPAYELLD